MGYRGPVNFMGEDKELRQPKRCSLTSFGKKLKGGGMKGVRKREKEWEENWEKIVGRRPCH